jgi:2-oxoglutarate dehydrogenase E2 component (dihydrolipoamide succinyltransferase)
MSIEVTVPQLGESIVEATVGRWRKAEGDTVKAGESLVELETDKINLEVTSPADGVLASIYKHEGDTIGVGEMLAQVSESQPPRQPDAPKAAEAVAQPAASSPTTAMAEKNGASATRAVSGMAADEPSAATRATPLARRMADERHIDLQAIRGTGSGGKITHEDVEAYRPSAGGLDTGPQSPTVAPTLTPAPALAAPAGHPAGLPPAAEARREERVRMSRRRQTIARRLVEAQHTAAMLTTFNEIDMSAVIAMRQRRRDAFKERHGVGLGYMSFFTKAVLGALRAYPRLNAEVQGDEMVLKHYYDIGIAVGVEEGLVVPVLRDADRLSFAEIERRIAAFADKARTNQLSLEDIRGGTFTISNGGVFGSLLSTPILNSPQVGILGMHAIQERPIALSGQVVIHPMMYVALSYDHRIVDGNEAVRFLVRIKELLEEPEALLLDG